MKEWILKRNKNERWYKFIEINGEIEVHYCEGDKTIAIEKKDKIKARQQFKTISWQGYSIIDTINNISVGNTIMATTFFANPRRFDNFKKRIIGIVKSIDGNKISISAAGYETVKKYRQIYCENEGFNYNGIDNNYCDQFGHAVLDASKLELKILIS